MSLNFVVPKQVSTDTVAVVGERAVTVGSLASSVMLIRPLLMVMVGLANQVLRGQALAALLVLGGWRTGFGVAFARPWWREGKEKGRIG